MKSRTKLAAVMATAVIAGTGCSCTYVSPDAGTAECAYKGGPFDSKGFEKVVAPGSGRTSINQFGSSIPYPVNVRQYDKSDGLPDVTVTVRGVPMTFSPVVNFTISSVPLDTDDDGEIDKPAGCELIERHLRPLKATDFDADGSRWASQFLNIRMAGVIKNVAPKVLQGLDPTALAQNIEGTRDSAAEQFGVMLTEGMVDQLGGAYFCKPSYQYGQGEEACGTMNVVLSEPVLSAEDASLIARPQRAKTEADVAISEASEAARKAQQIAEQKQIEADSATALATANETIAQQEARVLEVDAANTYAWCTYLTTLGQDCALVKAAENSDFPDFFTPDPPAIAVPAGG